MAERPGTERPGTERPVADFICALPKAELHVHLVGSASVSTVLELARRHPDKKVPADEQSLRAFYEFRDFAHFIEVYIAVNSLIQRPEDVEALVGGVAADLAAQQVRYAEVTVTPDSHLLMGIDPVDLASALTSARAAAASDHGIELAWIFDIPGELGLESGERTIDWVERHAPVGTVGFGLGGPEVGVGRPQFSAVFERARAAGLKSVPHAGETTGAQTVWDALRDLHADRIGHGIAAATDEQLLEHLAERGVPLEVCPTSNVCTKAVTALEEHPFPVLRDAGVAVTLNSDDPGMFSTSLNHEYEVAHQVWGLDAAALADLARSSVRASYAPGSLKTEVVAEIDAYTRAQTDVTPS